MWEGIPSEVLNCIRLRGSRAANRKGGEFWREGAGLGMVVGRGCQGQGDALSGLLPRLTRQSAQSRRPRKVVAAGVRDELSGLEDKSLLILFFGGGGGVGPVSE